MLCLVLIIVVWLIRGERRFYQTQHQHFEAVLHRTLTQLAKIQHITHMGYCEWNMTTGQQRWSEELFEIFGLPPKTTLTTVELFENAIHPDDRQKVMQITKQTLEQGKAYSIEFRIIHFDGHIKQVRYFAELGDRDESPYLIGVLQDVTEYNKEIIDLRESREFLQEIIENINTPIFVKNLQGHYILVNKAYTNLLNCCREEILDKTDYQIHTTEDADRLRANDKMIQAGRCPFKYEETLKFGEQKRTFITSKIPLLNRGQVYAICGISMEITERKQMEEALRRNESRLEEIERIAHLGDWEWDVPTNRLFWSYEIFQIFRLRPHEFKETYQGFLERVHPDDRQRVDDAIQQAFCRKKPYNIEHRIIFPDSNDVRFVYERAEVTFDEQGNPLRMLGMVQDITERHAIEEKLWMIQYSIDQVTDSIFWMSREGRLMDCNKTAHQKLGYEREELLNLTITDIDPNFFTNLLENRWSERAETRVIQIQSFHRTKIGEMFPVDIMIHDMQFGDHQYFCTWVRDISKLKQAEWQLRQAKESAEAANRAKTAFLANMSHELRTPLNAILGYTQILKRHPSLTAEQQNGLNVIQRSSDYLLTLISDILDMAKVEAGRLEVCPIDFDFNQFLENTRELFKIRAQQKGISFSTERLSYLPKAVRADERRLRQILMNLLSNAIKFTEEGGIILKVGYHHGRIRFQVEDTGIGITSGDLEKIFLPFQQVGNKEYFAEGTGLGLSITKGLVEVMGGQLHVKSVPGQGTTFWFSLNLPEIAEFNAPENSETQMIVGYLGLRRKILIVDDKPENREVLANLLESLNFLIAEANNGQEAINRTRAWQPDLIFMDLVMPGIDGFRATQQIRQTLGLHKIVIIAVSASAFEYSREQSQAVGCDDFIAKPFKIETVLSCLEQLLSLKWIYHQSVQEAASPIKGGDESLSYLSNEQAVLLLDLVKRGDIDGIIELTKTFEQKSEHLKLLAGKVRQLCKPFKRKKLIEIAERYLNNGTV
ncbi:MAG: hypothetical protein BWK79_09900 [Beggiatoa sp. IS2]|nr:MAG: hypothetical protein BWK79_09900 [Beggiatoa sp. IS2]